MPPSVSTQHVHSQAHARGHAHTLSGSTKTNHSIASHPYNPAYHLSQITATTATFAEEPLDRGRQRKPRPISNSSSFAALSPSSEHLAHYPSTKPLPTASYPTPAPTSSRRPVLGTSFIALDGGFIGQSPVASVSTREGRDTWKSDKAPHRSSLASFMTFGQSRKSVTSATMPLSAQSTSFPHGASKLRGESRREREEDSDGNSPSFIQPVLPAFLRQRSQSYVDETEQSVERKRREEEEQRRRERPDEDGRRSVRVMAPTSFFDTSPFEERPPQQTSYRTNPPVALTPFPRQPHPYHQHYQPASTFGDSQGVNLASPVNPSFDFPHPYAISAPDTAPRPSRSDSMRGPLAPRLVFPSSHPISVEPSPVEPSTHHPFPFINPFASEPGPTLQQQQQQQHTSSQPTSRPATPKNRLRALASDKLKTLKGSISTPNLRAVARAQQAVPAGNQPLNATSRNRAPVPPHPIAGTSNWAPPTVVLQGQTICDTFIFPRPRFHAHQISPPDTPPGPTPSRTPVEPSPQARGSVSGPVEPARGSSWQDQRRATTTALFDTPKPRILARGVAKKASAPDLRTSEKRPSLKNMRGMSEAEKAILRGEALQKERQEWASVARKSFQNSRSRSLSRTRTKSIAKAANDAITSASVSAAAEEQERQRARRMAAMQPTSSSVAHTAPGSAPPTATSSAGGHPTKEEGHARSKERSLNVQSSIDYLAQRAFAQGHVAVVSTSSLHHHGRQPSGDTTINKGDNAHGVRRSESWGRSALKRAKNACIDPEAVSPGVEKVFAPDVPRPAISTVPSLASSILDITVPRRDEDLAVEEEEPTSSAVGVAIGTPPIPSLLTTTPSRIEHPYATPISSPTRPYVGPHPASPVLTALPPHSLNDVATRHRLPPHAVVSPPRSPQLAPSIAGLDHYLPAPPTAHQETLSRESWLVYMNAMEPGQDRLSPVEERSTSKTMSPVDDYERQEVPEDIETQRNSPDMRLDEASPLRTRVVSPDLEAELTKAFQRHSTASVSESENEYADLTFQAGATLTRLLSSRSVTATPRPSVLRALSNRLATEKVTPGTEKTANPTDNPELLQVALPRQASSIVRSPLVEERPVSRDSDALTGSGQDGSWRKSTISSEGGAAQSQESSPKASPRALLNLDDLEGYSDLFYNAGQGNSTSRPRSSSSFKTNNSGDRTRRVDVITFGSKSSDTPSLAEQILSTPQPPRMSSGILWAPTQSSAGEPSGARWQRNPMTELEVRKTWDPEEDDEPYSIVNPRLPMLPRSIVPIRRHSTKLSVIEGSIDDHATASESTAEDRESVSASSPIRPGFREDQGAIHSSGTLPTVHHKLHVPSQTHRRATSSERAVAPEGFARTSFMTSTSGQSRMSNLSDFPVPPVETADFTLTPSNVLSMDYFPPRLTSPTPVSPLSAEPGSPTADDVENASDSDGERGNGDDSRRSSSHRAFRENRSTFGPDTDVAREWAQHQRQLDDRSPTPTTEER